MHELSLIDASFQREKSKQYHLSIQADMLGLTFCVYDLQLKKHTAFRNYLLQTGSLIENFIKQLGDVFRTDDLLALQYFSSSFMYLSQKSTLVPDSYFDKNQLKKYLAFNQDLETLDEIHFNYLPSIDAYNVFALHTYIASEVNAHIKGVNFFHQGTTCIGKTLEATGALTKDVIAVNLNNHFFDLVVSNGGKLKLYNTFQYMGHNDLLYFMLYISKQFNCDPADVKILLSGEIKDLVNYFEAIRSYFPGVQYARSLNDNLSNGLARLREYNYLNLFNIVNCE